MQVALTTMYVRNNDALQHAAYLFTLWSIIVPIAVLLAIAAALIALSLYYTLGTLAFCRQAACNRRDLV
jgi:hypothetical protein